MSTVRDVSKTRSFFSLAMCVMLISSTLLIGISLHVPNASAGALTHDIGNVDIPMLTDYGRILNPIKWWDTPTTWTYQTSRDWQSLGFIGLVIDQDNYNHTPGSEDIADSFESAPYTSSDDLKAVSAITWLNDGSTGPIQKSFATLQNEGVGTLDPYDILINQTA